MIGDQGQSDTGLADSRENFSFVDAGAQYGWQVSAATVAVFEVGTK